MTEQEKKASKISEQKSLSDEKLDEVTGGIVKPRKHKTSYLPSVARYWQKQKQY